MIYQPPKKVKFYELRTLETVEAELVSDHDMALRKGCVKGAESHKRNFMFVHHIDSKRLGTNHSYKDYDCWVTVQRMSEFNAGYARKNILTMMAVSILKKYRGIA